MAINRKFFFDHCRATLFGGRISGAPSLFSGNITTTGTLTAASAVRSSPDSAYDATAWDGSNEFATKDAIRDKIESLGGGRSIGSVNFAAGASSVVVTNNTATATSLIFVTPQANDSTCKSFAVTRAAGSFTITANAACAAETPIAFFVTN